MPALDTTKYAEMPAADLEARRRALVAKAAGNHDNLDLDDLHELAAITGVLRRKASGPPKEAKGTKTPRAKAAKAAPAALDDLV